MTMENVNNLHVLGLHIYKVIIEKSGFIFTEVITLLYCNNLYKLNK
jgi:hypothetical protein